MSPLTKLSFRHLLTLKVLHRTRSMSETANEIGRTQPAISQQVDAVEDAVGFPVLHHRRGGVHFTARGDHLVREATVLLHEFGRSVDAIGRMSDERLRIGIPQDLRVAYASWLNPIEEGNIEIMPMTSQDVLQAFKAGEIDLGIAATARPLERSARTWRFGLSWAGCRPSAALQDDIRIVSLPQGCLYAGIAANTAKRARLRVERHLMFDSIEKVFSELKNGGVTIMSSHLAASLGYWCQDASLPPLPKANLNLLVSENPGDHLAWAAKTLAGGMSKATHRRAGDPIPGLLKELGVDIRLYGSA